MEEKNVGIANDSNANELLNDQFALTEEAVATDAVIVAEESSDCAKVEKKPSPFAGIKEQKGLKAKIRFFFDVLEKYPDVRQMIMFMLFSMLCGAGQMGSQFILQYTLELVPSLGPEAGEFHWFIFTGTCTAEFIGFAVGAVVGQTLTYILNRKKTFRATNNLALSITLYFVLAIGITILQTLIPGWITTPCKSSYIANYGSAPEGFVDFLIKMAGTAVGGLTALVTSFLGNKFIVMRDWGKKNKNTEIKEK